MLIEDSYALLAPLSSNGEHPDVLLTDDDRFEARARGLADTRHMQMMGVALRHDATHTGLFLDHRGQVAAIASADSAAEADALARGDLRRKGITLLDESWPLLADAVTGSRRTSVLKYGEGLNLRVKRMDDDAGGTWLHVRAYLDTVAGYIHPVLTDRGHLVCLVSGRTDQDAWTRVQGELNRQGIEFA